MHPIRRVALPALGILFIAAAAAPLSQPPQKNEEGSGPQQSIVEAAVKRKALAGRKGDEAGVRAVIAAYTQAFNRGDAAAIAALWSDDGVYSTSDGESFSGRAAIAKAIADGLKESKGMTLELGSPAVRFLSVDVASEEGVAKTMLGRTVVDEVNYLALYVRREGKWLLDSVRETARPPAPSNSDKLGVLEWMVGDWVAEGQGENAEVAMRVDWAKNRSFLRCSFRVAAGGSVEQEGTQVVGWDPARGVVRGWTFDSDGGFGESTWSLKDNCWTIRAAATLPDGRSGAATHLLTKTSDDTYTWRSIGRKVGDAFQPNVAEVRFVRRPAAKEGAAK